MLMDIINVKYVADYILIITFENGEKKKVNLENRLNGEIFEPLRNVDFFKKVYVDKSLGTIAWSNGADKAPDNLYEIGENVE